MYINLPVTSFNDLLKVCGLKTANKSLTMKHSHIQIYHMTFKESRSFCLILFPFFKQQGKSI